MEPSTFFLSSHLSEELKSAIKEIATNCPDVVFGGSIALNAFGLLDRPVHDIDIFVSDMHGLNNVNLLSIITDPNALSSTVTDMHGKAIKRVGFKFMGVSVCVFKVDNEQLDSTKILFDNVTLNIQIPIHAFLAKMQYKDKDKKHADDLIHMVSQLFKKENKEEPQTKSPEREDKTNGHNLDSLIPDGYKVLEMKVTQNLPVVNITIMCEPAIDQDTQVAIDHLNSLTYLDEEYRAIGREYLFMKNYSPFPVGILFSICIAVLKHRKMDITAPIAKFWNFKDDQTIIGKMINVLEKKCQPPTLDVSDIW